MSRVVRKNRPDRWDVTRPRASASGLPSRNRMSARNWYSSPLPSTAIDWPLKSVSATVRGSRMGVSTTPMGEFYRLTAYGLRLRLTGLRLAGLRTYRCYFVLRTSYFVLRTSYFVLRTSYFPVAPLPSHGAGHAGDVTRDDRREEQP